MSGIRDSISANTIQTDLQIHAPENQTPGAELGGHNVQAGNGRSVGKAISDFFSGIKDAITGLKDRISNYFEQRKVTANQDKFEDSTNQFFATLHRDNTSPKDVLSSMQKMLRYAGKISDDAPTKILDTFRAKLGELSSYDQETLVAKLSDPALKQGVMDTLDERIQWSNELNSILHEQGLVERQDITVEGNAFKQSIQSLFTGFEAEVQGIVQQGRQAKLDHVQNLMPSGVNVGQDGEVTGTIQITTVPNNTSTLIGDAGRPVKDVYTQKGENALQGSLVTIDNLDDLDDQQITSQAEKDLYRLDLEIPVSAENVYKSTDDKEEDPKTRNKTIVRNLRDFSGSDEATTVLSSILTQSSLRVFHDSLPKPDGSESLLTFGANRQGSVKMPDGSIIDLGVLKNYGGAKLSLSKNDQGNFQLDINWTMYPTETGRGYGKEPLPLHEGGTLMAKFDISITIDSVEARRGNLAIDFPKPPSVTFSGCLTV